VAAKSKSNFSKVLNSFLSISTLLSYFGPQKGFRGHTTYSAYGFSDGNMDIFACRWSNKVVEMPNLDSDGHLEDQYRQMNSVNENLAPDEDLFMEQILENINTTPIGQVLKKIASLPEIRKEKVLEVRRQLTEGRYNLNGRLDIALDRVLEDLTT
jgi:hypothetical protein